MRKLKNSISQLLTASDGSCELNNHFKMFGIVELCGTDQGFKALEWSVFELSFKKWIKIHTRLKNQPRLVKIYLLVTLNHSLASFNIVFFGMMCNKYNV